MIHINYKITLCLISISLALLCSTPLKGQVTIGSNEPSNSGALLDLKENSDEGVNSTRGLMLPRVSLKDSKSLEPITDKQNQNLDYAGIVVYNLTNGVNGLCKGVNAWDGNSWISLSGPCRYIKLPVSELTFYKSAPHPKPIQVDTYPANANVPLYFEELSGATISWLPGFGIPPQLNVDGKHYIQPKINTTPNSLKSEIDIKATANDASKENILKVTQLERDLLFQWPTRALEPQGGTISSYNVNSESKWKVASKRSDPDGIISMWNTNVISEGSNSFNFSLATNKTFKDREATLDIVAPTDAPTYLDFVPQTHSIKQEHEPLILNSNVAGIYFGYKAGAEVAKITTNAGAWKMTASEPSFSQVVGVVSPALNVEHPASSSALTAIDNTITLTPRTDYAGLGAAGSELRSSLDITTLQHDGEPSKTHTITLTRQVPLAFEFVGLQIADDGTATATAKSNAQWTLDVTDATQEVMPAANYKTGVLVASAGDARTTWMEKTRSIIATVRGPNGFKHSYDIIQNGYQLNPPTISHPLTGTPTGPALSHNAFSITFNFTSKTHNTPPITVSLRLNAPDSPVTSSFTFSGNKIGVLNVPANLVNFAMGWVVEVRSADGHIAWNYYFVQHPANSGH